MKITIAAVGSRGDVQPYIALGLGLRRAGHEVALSAPAVFAELIAAYGLEHRPLSVDPRRILEHPSIQAASKSGNPLRLMRSMFREGAPLIRTLLAEAYGNCRDCDAVILTAIPNGAYDAAEQRGIPFFQAGLGPVYPTGDFPMFALNFPNLRIGFLNRLTYALLDQAFWLFFRSHQNAWRKEKLGLSPLPMGGPARRIAGTAPFVLGFSPSVAVPPQDWPPSVRATGYWFLDDPPGWRPPAGLEGFLAGGPAPVSVGFGSMPDADSPKTTGIVLEAVRLAGMRCVLIGGWGGLGSERPPETACAVDEVPHSWLFPRMAALVHHGGAGSTAAGLRSGVPSVVTPSAADQFFWARAVERLGAGPKPISYHALTAERLARRIRQAVDDPVLRQRAAEFGRRIEAERGVERAVEFINGYL
jgi:sterol 3beta-glucosyltransferase